MTVPPVLRRRVRFRLRLLSHLFQHLRQRTASLRHEIASRDLPAPGAMTVRAWVAPYRTMFLPHRAVAGRRRTEWGRLERQAPDFSGSSLVRALAVRARHYAHSTWKTSLDARLKRYFSVLWITSALTVAQLTTESPEEAFIETIAELAENGITDIDGLDADQIQTIFELYATHAIEARLCNDIGTKAITLPVDPSAARRVQAQLLDFVRRGVADSLTSARTAMQALTPDRVLGFVTGVYEQAFFILQTLGDAEAGAT
jgi:hypothetical protein